jgi:hypothetical protein
MTEGNKTLNSSVSTLKKNPGRVGRLVKAAKLLIVPPKQYASGKAKDVLDAAVKKLKAKRGLNGVVGEGAGPFSDKALEKAAADKKSAGYAAAVGATGAAAGMAVGRDLQKHKAIVHGHSRNLRQLNKGTSLSKVYDRAETFNRRAARTVKGAGRRGALIGGVAGALTGLAAGKLEKKAEDEGKKVLAGAVGGAIGANALASPVRAAKVDGRITRMNRRKRDSDFKKVLSGVRPKRDSLKFDETAGRRMGKAVRRNIRHTTGKGAAAGAVLAGAAALARNMKKEASMNKEAVSKGTKDKALAATAVGSGAALGGVIAHDAKKSRITSRVSTKGAYKHMGQSAVDGAEKRLAANAKTLRRMSKPLKGAGIKGAIAGGLAGAALGAAHLKKEASVLNSRTVQQRASEGFKILKRRQGIDKVKVDRLKAAGKKAALVAGVTGAGVAVTKKNEQLKKQAAELVIKDGKKYRKGTVASAANTMAAVNGTLRAVGKGGIKNVAKAALNGGLLGGAYGTVRGANRLRKGEISLDAKEMKKLRSKGLAKKAAELLHHNGEDIRRGTIGSAAKKMAIGGATLGGLAGLSAGPVGAIMGATAGGIGAGLYGGAYGLIRGALRSQDGEKSMTPAEFDKLKAKLA